MKRRNRARLVQELVKLHAGSVGVVSELEHGSTFTVNIPLGAAHLPADRLGGSKTLISTGLRGEAYVDEVLKWLPQTVITSRYFQTKSSHRKSPNPRRRSFGRASPLADDNADMRDYVNASLSGKYEVEAVADGEEAIKAIRKQPFDLVLSDVMMPKLDGFDCCARCALTSRRERSPSSCFPRARVKNRELKAWSRARTIISSSHFPRALLARVESHLNLQRERKRAGSGTGTAHVARDASTVQCGSGQPREG